MPTFHNEKTNGLENIAAGFVAAKWGCEVTRYPDFHEVDWYGHVDGRMRFNAEIKCRTHEFGKYESIMLGVRKWWALYQHWISMGIPSIFFVRYNDGRVFWIDIKSVDARNVEVGGRTSNYRVKNDIEPVVHIPIEHLTEI